MAYNSNVDYEQIRSDRQKIYREQRDKARPDMFPVLDTLKETLDEVDAFHEWRQTKDHRDELNQKALDDLLKKANAVPLGGGDYGTLKGLVKSVITENTQRILDVRKDMAANFKFKDFTIGSSLTGSAVRSYLEPVHQPGTGRNFRDMIRMTPTATGLISLPRHTSTTGSFSKVPEGGLKPEIDKTISMVDFKAQFIAGITEFSKETATDLPFFQQWLSEELMIDFNRAENLQLVTDLTAVAVGAAGPAGANIAETMINNIAALGAVGYVPNGILSSYTIWAALLQVKGGASASYGLPGAVTTDPQGAVRVGGVPVYPVAWIPNPAKCIYGDWSQAQLAVSDTLQLQFFEIDFKHNLISARLERREVLIVRDPSAFIYT